MSAELRPGRPSALWRAASAIVTTGTGAVVRAFKLGCSYEVHGLDRFVQLLDSRRHVEGRERGLITVSNHLSVVDDPFIWASLPFRHFMNPDNMRLSLGSYDICFKNKPLSTYFSLGQLLPTHRHRYSSYGGLFQPTMTQAIRLLGAGPFPGPHNWPSDSSSSPISSSEKPKPSTSDPFTTGALTYTHYTTNGTDSFHSPSSYANRRHAWVHIFPEGMINQDADLNMRYFKWGVARLILESEPCPDVVPIWIEGMEHVMSEARTFPRFVPRSWGKTVSVTFGERLDLERVFGDLRERWKRLCEKETGGGELDVGILTEALRFGDEAVELRKECTMRVRREVLKLRRERGRDDEDPKWSRPETFRLEGPDAEGNHTAAGSIAKDAGI